MASDAFCDWAAGLEWLSDIETLEFEPWKRTVAFVVQFGLMTMGDGAGSLFYNHPERVEHVADALAAVGELGMAQQVLAIDTLLQPLWDAQPDDLQSALVTEVLEGVAAAPCAVLDAELNSKWQAIQDRLEALARTNGWSG